MKTKINVGYYYIDREYWCVILFLMLEYQEEAKILTPWHLVGYSGKFHSVSNFKNYENKNRQFTLR